MKRFCICWGVLLFVLLLFCASVCLLFFSSVWYIFLFLISLFGLIEAFLSAIVFTDMLDIREGKKISKWLLSGGIVSLFIGVIMVFTMDYEDEISEISMVISVFFLCVAVISFFFKSIINVKKSDVE